MSQTSEEKTEKPSQKKLRDSRKKGQIAQCKDLTASIGFVSCFLVFAVFGWDIVMQVNAIFIKSADTVATMNGLHDLYMFTFDSLVSMVKLSFTIVLCTIIPVIVGTRLKQGHVFSFDPMMPQMSKLNPVSNIKNIFSFKSLFEVIKNMIKILILLIISYFIFTRHIGSVTKIYECGIYCLLPFLGQLLFEWIGFVILAFIPVTILDMMMQQHFFTKDQMMTKYETKKEAKDTVGNPQIKGKRRQLHREILNGGGSTANNVKKSNVVISNPTHFAVALYYERGKTKLPVVVAKGKDMLALTIRQAAEPNNIPVVQNVPLARALFDLTEVGEMIPFDYVKPVATILSWVNRSHH